MSPAGTDGWSCVVTGNGFRVKAAGSTAALAFRGHIDDIGLNELTGIRMHVIHDTAGAGPGPNRKQGLFVPIAPGRL